MVASADRADWPELPYAAWKDTKETLHPWMQIVGKVCVAAVPWVNHSWHITYHLTARGLVTPVISQNGRDLQIEFDFIDHVLSLRTSDGERRSIGLGPIAVADFYDAVMTSLRELGFDIHIHMLPNEIENPIRFDEDRFHKSYDRDYAQRHWRVLMRAAEVFSYFRTSFLGKTSPVHFFWGSFDLAVTRFSGRRAPVMESGNPLLPLPIAREAYSHEVSSAGFWAGGQGLDDAAFYAYAYPSPDAFASAKIAPDEAYFHKDLGIFILPYDVVRKAADPRAMLLEFLRSTYDAAADTGHWPRAELECALGEIGKPRLV